LSREAFTEGVNESTRCRDVFCLKYCVAASAFPLTIPSASATVISLMAPVKIGEAVPTASSAPRLTARMALST
jgi:hypothetical protein